jgi:hypothetical protein
LFTRLKEKGLQVDIPISIEQAEEEINRLVSTGSK